MLIEANVLYTRIQKREVSLSDLTSLQISDNFTWAEVFHNRGIDEIRSAPVGIYQNALVQARLMEIVRSQLRAKFIPNASIQVSSWWRSPKANQAIGGAKKSQHLQALATDFVVPGLASVEGNKTVQASLLTMMRAIGFCLEITGGQWSHVDARRDCIAFRPDGSVLTSQDEVLFIQRFGVKSGRPVIQASATESKNTPKPAWQLNPFDNTLSGMGNNGPAPVPGGRNASGPRVPLPGDV
jgi:hypothetical protein